MGGSFNANKLKTNLKMAVQRLNMASNKKSALVKQSMRDVAVLLAEDPPKEEKARIKAEALIRDDYVIEAYDILGLHCELLAERIKLLQLSKECPPDLVSCISTLVYAAPRVDIPELATIRKQFTAKYGKKFDENAIGNIGYVVNERVMAKLSIQPPAAYLVQTYLEQICEKYEVEWSSNLKMSASQMGEPMAPPSGYSVPIGQGTGLGPSQQQLDDMTRAHSGMTVTGDNKNNNDDESTHHDGGQSMPPPQAPPGGGGSSGSGLAMMSRDLPLRRSSACVPQVDPFDDTNTVVVSKKDTYNNITPQAPAGGGSSGGSSGLAMMGRYLPNRRGSSASVPQVDPFDDSNTVVVSKKDNTFDDTNTIVVSKIGGNNTNNSISTGEPQRRIPLVDPFQNDDNDNDENDNRSSNTNPSNSSSKSKSGKGEGADSASYKELAARFDSLHSAVI